MRIEDARQARAEAVAARKIPDVRTLRQRLLGELNDRLDNAAEFTLWEKEIETVDQLLVNLQRAEDLARGQARPAGGADDIDPNTKFRNFGEQLAAVMRARMDGNVHSALVRAPVGSGEVDPTGGGFLVQTDFANTVLAKIYDIGEIASRVMRLPPLAGNSIKIPAVDETSRVTGSRWGGVQAYWIGEGDSITASKPKFRLMNLDLKKLAAVYYASDELLQDTNLFGAIATQAFGEELQFMFEDAVWEGQGAGLPLGIMNAPCLITVPKDVGQAAGTLTYSNVLNMWSRCWGRSRSKAVWFINQDVEPQLFALNAVIGTAGVPVYLPPGGVSGAPFSTLFGRPVVPIEYASSLGTPGDIMLADMSQYTVVDKAGIQAASSMHVQFLTDQMAFRMIYRVDGQPMWNAPLTPFKGSNTKSPMVILAQR
jgi:HK97 family phage major capsid protein